VPDEPIISDYSELTEEDICARLACAAEREPKEWKMASSGTEGHPTRNAAAQPTPLLMFTKPDLTQSA
jgi:hypothetical protein